MVEFGFGNPKELVDAGRMLGVELDRARVSALANEGRYLMRQVQAEEAKELPAGSHRLPPTFSEDGLTIQLAIHADEHMYDEVIADFLRTHIAVPNSSERRPRPITHTMRAGILQLQNYCLLAEAGYIRRPKCIKGNTNPRMARASTYAGFVWDESSGSVSGDYETLRDTVFGSNIGKLLVSLERRVAQAEARPA